MNGNAVTAYATTASVASSTTGTINRSDKYNYVCLNRYQEKEDPIDTCCNECNSENIMECCDKCGNGVCTNESCAWLFPHYNASNYIICNSCVASVEKKLTVLVDYSKLELLKKKINKKIEKKIQSLETPLQSNSMLVHKYKVTRLVGQNSIYNKKIDDSK